MSDLESNKEDAKSEIIAKNKNNGRADYKIADTYIIDIVHNYFCIFHAWLPTNNDERFLLKFISYSTWSTLMLFLIFIFHVDINKLTSHLISFDFSVFWILALASFLILLMCLIIGYWYLSPKKVEILQARMKSELGIDISHLNLTNLKNKNYSIAKFDIEKLWFEKILNDGGSIESLTKKVESNIYNRKPSSRDIDSIIQLTLSNQYVVNLLLVILTVTLTVSLSPLIPSITDENFFSMMGVLNFSALYFWIVLVILFVSIKILFMLFIWSIENSTRNKMFVVWRYEIFRDMLARHQQVKIKKPRIRVAAVLIDKEQVKIENKSKDDLKIDPEDKIEDKSNQ